MRRFLVLFVLLAILVTGGVEGMAYISQTGGWHGNGVSGQASISVAIGGLQHPESAYGAFAFNINGGLYQISGTSHTFSGLTCGVTYTVAARAQYGGVWYDIDPTSVFVSCPNPEPLPTAPSPTYLTASFITQNSAELEWGIPSGLPWGQSGFRIRFSNGTVINTVGSTISSYSLGGLSPNTTYTVTVTTWRSGYNDSSPVQVTFTTQSEVPVPGQPGVINVTATGTTAALSWGPSSNVYYYIVEISRYGGGYAPPNQTVYTNSAFFEGLSPTTQYLVAVTPYNSAGIRGTERTLVFTTPARPPNWAWTTNEINAFTNGGATTLLTELRWDRFVDRVNEFRTYKNLSAISAYAPANKDIRAVEMRTVANAINDMRTLTDQRPRTVQAGDTILGSYYIMLADMLAGIT